MEEEGGRYQCGASRPNHPSERVGQARDPGPGTSQFRVNLTRSDLMVDCMPTPAGINQYACCLLAEFDQMSYSRRWEKTAPGQMGQPKLKKMEEGGPVQGGTGPRPSGGKGLQVCKYYNTEEGCKKGKTCRFKHEATDNEKRFWVCGSTKHFSGKRPTKGEDQTTPAQVQKAELERRSEEETKSDKGAVCPSEDMKGFLEEASRMLKTINPGYSSEQASADEGA